MITTLMQTNLQTTLKKKDCWIKTENDTKNQKPKKNSKVPTDPSKMIKSVKNHCDWKLDDLN